MSSLKKLSKSFCNAKNNDKTHQVPVKAYTRFGPLVAREVGEEQLDFDEVDHHCEEDQLIEMAMVSCHIL